ncbi:MAG: hypothetical protein WAL56_06505 [Candidatus Sulfotelmatobacter sp.]
MTTSAVTLQVSTSPACLPKKKRVLLLDASQAKRGLRADVMRKLGMDVDCAADVLEARCWWRPDLYNLVLINATSEADGRDKFCTDIRGANPAQRIAFFVGSPEYLAAAPHADATPIEKKELVAALLAQGSENASQRWGILEACKRISSVRSVSEARTRAMREAPQPSRWAEAIERHSDPEETRSQPTFAAPIAVQREELL